MASGPVGNHIPGISRRAFLAGGATVAALAVLPIATAARAAALVSSSGVVKRSTFTPLLGATFRMLDSTGHSTNVVLSEISDLKSSSAPGSETVFSLVFDGPKTSPRPSGTYRFRHAQTGDVALFVGPIDRGLKVKHYEAVVNQR
ncbi:MAG: hypothetical protein QOE07_1181 [Acidimicrobiaceae bacterium]|nr:hypothetical protein [Acidimicrobiaceae bacterium]